MKEGIRMGGACRIAMLMAVAYLAISAYASEPEDPKYLCLPGRHTICRGIHRSLLQSKPIFPDVTCLISPSLASVAECCVSRV
jgi:hypothetical protein